MTLLAIALNDLTRSFRSAFAVGMMVVAPLLLTGLIAAAFGGRSGGNVALTPIQVGVVDADRLPAGAVLTASLGTAIRSMFFDPSVQTWLTARDYPDEAAARAAVEQQAIGVAVIIPAQFTAQYLSGGSPAPVRILSDPTLSIGPAVVGDMVTALLDAVAGGGIALTVLQERQQANGRTVDAAQFPAWLARYTTWYQDFQRALFHDPARAALVVTAPAAGPAAAADPLQSMLGLLMSGQMIFFAFFTAAYAMLSIVREAEEGTLARLFTTPVDRTTVLAGKVVAVLFLVTLQGLVLLLAGRFAFGIHWGAPVGVAVALVGQVLAASGLGVLLISFVQTTRQGGAVLGGVLTTLGMLGGLFTANLAEGLPAVFTVLSRVVPQAWVLQTWRMVLAGRPLADLWPSFAVTVVLGGLMLAVGTARFRRRYA